MLIAPLGIDDIGNSIRTFYGKAEIELFTRNTYETPISDVHVNGLNRFVERDPDPVYINPDEFPQEEPAKYCGLHLDGKEPEVALHHAKAFRRAELDVYLDANPRDNTEQLIEHSTIVFASEAYFLTRRQSFDDFFNDLRNRRVWFGGVTLGEHGVEWFAPGISRKHTDAPVIHENEVEDTSGAGDGFHGALEASLDLRGSNYSWEHHIVFASNVGGMMVRKFGNTHFPTMPEVEAFMRPRLVANA